MKFMLALLLLPISAPAAVCERYVCQAVGAGGGSSGTSHVEWAYGNDLAETKTRAVHLCARSTGGYSCAVSCQKNQASGGGIFTPACTDPWKRK